MQENNDLRLYSAGDIAAILDISANSARDFLDDASRKKLFPVIKVGVQYQAADKDADAESDPKRMPSAAVCGIYAGVKEGYGSVV